jgi:tRNA threonylcarbamoyl adenosine modification protein YeaZ
MIILAAETSTLLGSVAVLKDHQILAHKESMRQGSHSEVLNTFIEQALKEAQLTLQDIDLFATGIGPGSFTGIRICLNTIKTFSYCFNKPCATLNSLQNLASPFLSLKIENRPVVSIINAYKNMVYLAVYKVENSKLLTIQEPQVVRVQNIEPYLKNNPYLVGDGYQAYQKYFETHYSGLYSRFIEAADEPHATTLARWADQNPNLVLSWDQLLPIYLRESEAEENAKGIKYRPLF